MPSAIGIDFGTTKTVVAVVEGGKPRVIANAEGSSSTPAVVAFTDGQSLVGARAKRQAVMNPRGTMFSVKRFLGRSYSEVAEQVSLLPYPMEQGSNDAIRIRMRDCLYAPEEIAAVLLRKLVGDAEDALGELVREAVIAVPAAFTHAQRQAVWDAGKMAGLDVLQILNEPTAVAMAYDAQQKKSATVMVFDLGGGAFDVSVLDLGGEVCEVRATAGDSYLGGDDFDRYLVEHVVNACKREHGNDRWSDHQMLLRLYEAVERAKCELSDTTQATISLPYLTTETLGPRHLNMVLTRAQFEDLAEPLVQRCAELVQQALFDAQRNQADIDEVLLVGGMSRTPMIQTLVKGLVGDQGPILSMQPDDMAALGAAILARSLEDAGRGTLLFDVTPLSLSVESPGREMITLIERNTPLPCRRTAIFSTTADHQSALDIVVWQGERGRAPGQRTVGHVRVEELRPALRGGPQIEVAFEIDTNGLLSVQARDQDTGIAKKVTVRREKV